MKEQGLDTWRKIYFNFIAHKKATNLNQWPYFFTIDY